MTKYEWAAMSRVPNTDTFEIRVIGTKSEVTRWSKGKDVFIIRYSLSL